MCASYPDRLLPRSAGLLKCLKPRRISWAIRRKKEASLRVEQVKADCVVVVKLFLSINTPNSLHL